MFKIRRFFSFNDNYLATLGIEYLAKDITIDNKTIRLKIWDSVGQERHKSLTKIYFRNTQGIIIVYDITNSESFEDLNYWLDSVKNNINSKFEDFPIIIIGNKIDSEEREVQFNEAELFAKSHNYPYFETSAKTGENIEEAFNYLIMQIIKSKNNINEDKNENNDNIKLSLDKEQENYNCFC